MAKLRFNKQKSLEAGEVILDEFSPSGENLDFDDTFKEPADVPMETTVSTNAEPTAAELQLAKELSGTPTDSFDRASIELLESLCRKGIASNHDGLYGRGFRWHEYF